MHSQKGLFVEESSGKVWVDGELRPGKLTKKQRKLLLFLGARQGEVCTREETVAAIYEQDYNKKTENGRLDALVERARRIIGDDSRMPRFLVTVHRIGHRLHEFKGYR